MSQELQIIDLVEGDGRIETYTIVHGREGPTYAIAIGRLPDGKRFIHSHVIGRGGSAKQAPLLRAPHQHRVGYRKAKVACMALGHISQLTGQRLHGQLLRSRHGLQGLAGGNARHQGVGFLQRRLLRAVRADRRNHLLPHLRQRQGRGVRLSSERG